jgi:2-polyprenyl-3-methyl-5-hydroxy-6-metoxy-1,4-benzoquinol methylase
MKAKHLFALKCAARRLLSRESLRCPSCGGNPGEVLDRKGLVLTLARCGRCRLLFRQPTTPPQTSRDFYQNEYSQGYTTDMPDEVTLCGLMARGFAGTERDYSRFVRIFDALGVPRDARVLEFGCSWGYGAWQLNRAGYDVEAFEISRPRCRYAREKLGVEASHELEALGREFDLVFSSHVLEHVDSLEETLRFLEGRLKSGGLMVHVTPNGSLFHRAAAPLNWHYLWGEVHPQLLDEEFCRGRHHGGGIIIGGTPSDPGKLHGWDRASLKILDLQASELLYVAALGQG